MNWLTVTGRNRKGRKDFQMALMPQTEISTFNFWTCNCLYGLNKTILWGLHCCFLKNDSMRREKTSGLLMHLCPILTGPRGISVDSKSNLFACSHTGHKTLDLQRSWNRFNQVTAAAVNLIINPSDSFPLSFTNLTLMSKFKFNPNTKPT